MLQKSNLTLCKFHIVRHISSPKIFTIWGFIIFWFWQCSNLAQKVIKIEEWLYMLHLNFNSKEHNKTVCNVSFRCATGNSNLAWVLIPRTTDWLLPLDFLDARPGFLLKVVTKSTHFTIWLWIASLCLIICFYGYAILLWPSKDPFALTMY